jgi:hypothetical protein
LDDANVLQAAMFAINASFMYQAFGNFYKLLEKMVGSYYEFSARSAYLELKNCCESKMYEHLKAKIRDFIVLIQQTMLKPGG